MGLAGVILAAGDSTRMGRDKALLPWPPDAGAQIAGTLLSSTIHALARHSDLVIVVAGKNASALQPIVWGCGAFLVENPSPELGQFSSLQTGLRDVLNRGWDSALITLVDRPPAQDATLSALMNAFENRSHETWAIVPEFQGKHGHPILIGRELIEEFLKAPATANAREIEHANQAHILYVPVNDASVVMNLNTSEDYASIKSRS